MRRLLPCGHVAMAGSSRLCAHLIGTEGGDHVLTGHGLDSDACCRACDQAAQAGEPIELVVVCEGCVTRCADEDWSDVVAWRGVPGIVDRPEPFDAGVVPVRLPVPVVDIAPVAFARDPLWLLLADDGRIGRFDADRGTWEVLARCTVPDEPGHTAAGHRLRRRLHASANGRFAAVVNDFGRHGQVLDLVTGKETLTLDGGDYPAKPCRSPSRSSNRARARW